MTLEEFLATVDTNTPPDNLSPPLHALWIEAKGDWDRAHEIVQNSDTPETAWVHAYLHRKEGDRGNAAYWYRRAGQRPLGDGSFDDEWRTIAAELLMR
ncbi:hypothetical protein GF420_09700 [candidate division GN15 bacterium]|nr:hypothetical protein [candidate division GN15 bacterium]